MRRFFASLLALCSLVTATAGNIRSINISVDLTTDGSARVCETWDIDADRGTEWYLVKENLGDICIRDFEVSENGSKYIVEKGWDSNRSRAQKAGCCGILHKSDGVELCWGIGDYGHHIYNASYTMTNAVKAAEDYDFLHIQFVSPGLSDEPKKVFLNIRIDGKPVSTENCRIWGFGFDGETGFENGSAFAKSNSRLEYNQSVILLLRFDKGLMQPSGKSGKTFEQTLQTAMKGANFSEESDLPDWTYILFFILGGLFLFKIGFLADRANKKRIIGTPRLKDIGWWRDTPFGGDLLASNYTLEKLGLTHESSRIAGAMILRMVQEGQLIVSRSANGKKVDISFNDNADFTMMSDSSRALYQMMKEASGSDLILQDGEFSRWSSRHTKRIDKWVNGLDTEAVSNMQARGELSSGLRYLETGREQARRLVGFRKFLKDYTLSSERSTAEAGVWNDYLVFGALFGIADKVAKELADIDPKKLEQTVYSDPFITLHLINQTVRLSTAITNASAAARAAASGMGGHTSFGGGGGFSGGGFGGGAR